MTARRPLVAVTRAAEQAGGLAERLRVAGFDVLEVPVIAIAEPPDGGAALSAALVRLPEYDWLVVTSPNGGARVAAALHALPAAARPKVAAVGPGTAAVLATPPDLVAAESVGEGLVAVFPHGTGRVLLAQAEAARPVVAEGLRAKGWDVDAVVAYRTVAASPAPEALAALARADAVVFTSASTVRRFVEAAGPTRTPPIVVSIGPQTTEAAHALGLAVSVTADPHTLDGLVSAVAAALGCSSG